MSTLRPLSRTWKNALAALVAAARSDLLIVSPFVGVEGTDLVLEHLSASMRSDGRLVFLTDLSPVNVCQASTDPAALMALATGFRGTSVRHLPRVHAKAYIADAELAIVTSGNLTAGGLLRNFEYGVEIGESPVVREMQRELLDLASVGAPVSREKLAAYCDVAAELRDSLDRERRSSAAEARRRFAAALRSAEDELLRLRLAGGAMHTVFAKTICYLLRKHGPLSTVELHEIIANLHPDLCDDTVDRVIDGNRYGKKWKHAVRTAQQHLRARGAIFRDGRRWVLTPDGGNGE